MSEVRLMLDEVHALAVRCLEAHGCDQANARAVADTVTAAEGDRASAHGLFRLPGYVASLRSGKVNGRADPQWESLAPGVLRMDGDGGYAPLALQRARDPLAACARAQGIAAMALVRVHHFAALWIEIEASAHMSYHGWGFRGRLGPTGQESRAGRCGDIVQAARRTLSGRGGRPQGCDSAAARGVEAQEHVPALWDRFDRPPLRGGKERFAARWGASGKTRDAATAQGRPAFGGATRLFACVAALGRCPTSPVAPRLLEEPI